MDARERIIFAADVGAVGELRAYLKIFSGKIGAIKLGKEILVHALLTGEPVFRAVVEESDLQIMLV